MGFYIELKKSDNHGLEFREQGVPQVFLTLYGLCGFALTCMGLAAHSLLNTLLKTGDPLDLALVGSVIGVLPIYLLIGIKLFWVRKFIQFEGESLIAGYDIGKRRVRLNHYRKNEIQELLLINQRPSPNVAPVQHPDSQYYIRGHWRLLLKTHQGKLVTLDKHTEKEALHSLQKSVNVWLGLHTT